MFLKNVHLTGRALIVFDLTVLLSEACSMVSTGVVIKYVQAIPEEKNKYNMQEYRVSLNM